MRNLAELLRRLVQAEVEFVLVGGFAVVTHGVGLTTSDVDICLAFNEANAQRLLNALTGLPTTLKMRPDLPLTLSAAQIATLKNLYLRTALGDLDCLGTVLGLGDYTLVAAQSRAIKVSFGTLQVLSIEALITAKLALGRPHDLIAVDQLRLLPRVPEK